MGVVEGMSRVRGFEVVERVKDEEVRLPERGTKNSAGYDFYAYEDVVVQPSLLFRKSLADVGSFLTEPEHKWSVKPTLVKTGIKAYMLDDEVLYLYNRSSNPKKLGLILSNSVGVIDSDYYNNQTNEGEIGFMFYNILPFPVVIHRGDKIGQGVFAKFYKADGDNSSVERIGGFGSTGK